MKLPTQGFLIDATTGKIKWAWDHADPMTEFNTIPPIITDMQGNTRFIAAPTDIVVDATSIVAPGHMPELYHKYLRDTSFVRNPDGSWKIVLRINGQEIPHPGARKPPAPPI